MIHVGDCVTVMAGMPEASVDAVVTDPPYGLEFMGKDWDRLLYAGGNPALKEKTAAIRPTGDGEWQPGRTYGGRAKMPRCRRCGKYAHGNNEAGKGGIRCKCPVPDFDYRHSESGFQIQAWHEAWAREAFRVAKPGAYLVAAGGTRTFHRLVCALEDAGWEIRDTIIHCYASGFPKSLNLPGGLGTALKPAFEPWTLARKPLRGTVAANVARYGTGALNIGATRIAAVDGDRTEYGLNGDEAAGIGYHGLEGRTAYERPSAGRWPANVILTDPIFDGGVEGVVGGGAQESPATYTRSAAVDNWGVVDRHMPGDGIGDEQPGYGDSGTYSRFYLIPKADRRDREPLLRGQVAESQGQTVVRNRRCTKCGRQQISGSPCRCPEPEWVSIPRGTRENSHPTVKPVDLMRHLVRLVTPPGGTVLDPFLGSGTTAIACEMEGFKWVGIEQDESYVDIAKARLNGVQRGLGLVI